MPNSSVPHRLPRLRRLLALATDNWLARGYLAVFAACVLAGFVFPDGGFAPDPLMLTAPLSFLSVILPFGPGTEGGVGEVLAMSMWSVWLLLCALVNAAVLGALVARSTAAAPAGGREPRLPVSSEQEGTDMARTARLSLQGIRALLTPAVDNRLARGYLAVVAAALAFFLYAVYLSPDPGFAGIWPLMATAPLGIAATVVAAPARYSSLSWLSPLLFSAGVALSGLVNAVLLGLLARRLRAREASPA
ncbi:SCO4225 family membrane protein [Streptomyces sp. Ru72]|uniref:SCO4225 family membrane protein n=1 Tax=Streptomyces sp. Ru72 TaxID=2080747 RepID=UPI000CDE2BF5|nr:hypothetical protein [Streptomyces sp. Ru72]POX51223.1 hypothetical protein C3488_12075 [Streptomyces sp. Ru72]